MNETPATGGPSRRAFVRLALVGTCAGLLLSGIGLPLTAAAQSLKQRLAAGSVGEGSDGYLVARDPSAQSYVAGINAERRKIYEKRAKELGQSVAVVGKVYAKELYDRAASGTWFLTDTGWVQKP